MKKIFLFLIFLSFSVFAREKGQTEITTEEGIEVFQKEKYYLLKKNEVFTKVSLRPTDYIRVGNYLLKMRP